MFTITRKHTENQDIIIQHMTKLTHYIDDTKKKRKLKLQCLLPLYRISTRSQPNTTDVPSTRLNQINRFIENVFQIDFYLKSIKFCYCASMQRFIEFK